MFDKAKFNKEIKKLGDKYGVEITYDFEPSAKEWTDDYLILEETNMIEQRLKEFLGPRKRQSPLAKHSKEFVPKVVKVQ
jgi:hypothetical protein